MDDRLLRALRDGAAVITAGRRLAWWLRHDYDAIQQSAGWLAWPAPAIHSWSGWLDALWQEMQFADPGLPVLLGQWQEHVLWERVIDESVDTGRLLQKRAMAEAAAEAWQLARQWRLEVNRIKEAGGEDARAFASWARVFEQRCSAKGWLDRASLPDYLAARRPSGLPRRLLLAGFDEFTPQQRDFFDVCRRAGCAVEPWEPRERSRESVRRAAFADARAEMAAAARWTREWLRSGRAGRIAVVVPDLEARRNQVERIFRGILEPGFELPEGRPLSECINISAGRPLPQYPAARAALSILGLDPQETPWDDVSELLRCRFLAGAESEQSARAQLDARMRRKGESKLALKDLAEDARTHGCPVLARLIRKWAAVFKTLPSKQMPGDWSRTFAQLLSAFGWPGEGTLSSIDYQTVDAWSEVLSKFAGVDVTSAAMSRHEALAILRGIAAAEIFQPESVDAPVQVLGLMESSGLSFDHVWVAGLDDEAWPQAPKPSPLLPAALQRELGIPRCSPEREMDFARRVTARLIASAPDVVLSHAASTGDRVLAPSPLILDVAPANPAQLDLGDAASYAETIRQSRSIEQFVDEIAPPIEDGAPQHGGAKLFEYQSQCPFRAFAELRLRAENLETPAAGLDLRDRGTLLHAALEEVWRELGTHQQLCSHPNLAGVIQDSVLRALERWESKRGRALPGRFAGLEKARLERLIAEWLEYEKTREPFTVRFPEKERDVELGGIRAKVKIDRIDQLEDGREVIIDYKTGHPSPRDWNGDRPDEPQLPLYAVTHDKPLAAVLYARIRRGELGFLGTADEKVVIPGVDSADLAQSLPDWKRALESLAGQFRSGQAASDPSDPRKACRYCSLALLCRCGDRQKVEAEEE